jgi:hypothetical protein
VARREYVEFCEVCSDTTPHTEGRRVSRLGVTCLCSAGLALIGTLAGLIIWWIPVVLALVGTIRLTRRQVRCERCWWKEERKERGIPSEVLII